MNEIYVVDGVKYSVHPMNRTRFLQKHKNAKLLHVDRSTDKLSIADVSSRSAFGPGSVTRDEDYLLEKPSASMWEQTWLGRGFSRAGWTGEALDLYMEGSNVDLSTVEEFINGYYNQAVNYQESNSMKNFKKIYEQDKSWIGFFKGVKKNPRIMLELLVESVGTQVGTFMDSPKARIATATGFGGGFTYGARKPGDIRKRIATGTKYGITTSIGALSASMETALTFGELIEKELGLDNMTVENVTNLLQSPKGKEIRNKAIGRGLTIGAVETLTANLSGATTTRILQGGSSRVRTVAAVGAGVGVEAAGGGLGEVGGMLVAGQELDPAEIGFEAFTGTATAPLTVGTALLTHKDPIYKINSEAVTYNEMKDFIDTADDIDIATANIEIENDMSGLDATAFEKQTNAIIDSQIDNRITNRADRDQLISLEKERQQLERDSKKKGASKVPGIDENIERVETQINNIINKYEGAVGIGETQTAKQVQQLVADNIFEANLAFAKKHASIYGLEVNDKMSVKQIEEYLKRNNLDPSGVNSDGFIHGNQIIINKAVAKQTNAVNVGNHELLHGIIKKAMGDKKISSKVINDLKSKFGEQWNKVEAKVYAKDENGQRLYSDSYLQANPDEWITMLSDAIQNGEVVFNDSVFTQVGDILAPILRLFGFKKIGFESGQQVYNFLKEYNKSIHKGALSTSITRATGTGGVNIEGVVFSRSKAVEAVNKIEDNLKNRLKEQGKKYTKEEFQRSKEFNDLYESIVLEGGAINNYIKSLGMSPAKTKKVIQETADRLLNYDPEAKRKTGSKKEITIGEALMSNVHFAKLEAAKELAIEQKTEGKTIRIDAKKKTKEGEATFDIEDTGVDTETKAFEEKDMSPAAVAKRKKDKLKKKEVLKSKFRRKIGIKTGDDLYNKVLDTARKTLIRAYDIGKPVRDIQIDLRNEAVVYLFKDIKKFLGTKQYIQNLKEFRTAIIDVMFTADLVQMEREVAPENRVFTKFVRKLTKKEDVEAAVEQKLLPKEALNVIDKGQSVNLYEKVTPNEKDFIAFFDQPGINPITGKRSGLKGTRKDGLAKAMAGALVYDATMQVAQEPEVIQKRQDIAEYKGVEVLKDDLQVLASTIHRNQDIKFHKSPANKKLTYRQGVLKRTGKRNILEIYAVSQVLDDIWLNNSNILKYKNLTERQAERFGGKFIVDAAIDAYLNRGMDRIDTKILLDFIKKNKKKKQKISQVYEQYFIDNARVSLEKIKSDVKSNVVVREGGIPDVHFEYQGNSIGLEIKMDSARGVSVTWKFNDEYTVDNPANKVQQKELTDKIKNTTKLKIFEDIDFVNGVTIDQLENLKVNKSKFVHTVEVDSAYLEFQYTNKAIPEYFINIGEAGLFYMLGKDPDINIAVINIAKKLGIKRLSGKFNLYSRLNIGKPRQNGTSATTIRSEVQIDSKTFDKSKINLTSIRDMNTFVKELNSSLTTSSRKKNSKTFKDAAKYSRSSKNETKGISILDFDDTLATTKSKVLFVKPDGTKGSLNAEQYARDYVELIEQGYKFDFSEFSKVKEAKTAPLFNKALKLQGKFGPNQMFVLTARPADSAPAIHGFLKANGLNIPLKNITGLANSTSEAKAVWVAEKVAEGYNDFYFADDSLQNVQAVKNMLNQFDVKSKVQQARVKFSKSMNKEFNTILQDVTGIDAKKRFSKIQAKKIGANKGKWRFFVPPSHEDLLGLLYNFMGKGKEGNNHRAFFQKALLDPLNRSYSTLDTAKQSIAKDFKTLNEQFPDVKSDLNENIENTEFTWEDAIRVYLWNKHKHDIPGLNKSEIKFLSDVVKNDPELMAYAENLNVISKQKKYVKPTEGWESGDLRLDLIDATGRIGRAEFFKEFQENADILFSEENLNKIEAAYGSEVVSSLKDILYRIKTGRNRPEGKNKIVNRFNNYLSGSVAGVMFLNMRSALLQQLSFVNYLNFADNNIVKASIAFANQPQYWSDWAKIFNSDMLKERRGGIQTDINAAELANTLKNSRFPMRKLISKLLQLGYTPTQVGDSIAIATGGATFYRNRVNHYIKQDLGQKEAETKAWTDFQEITQATQQSARPDMVSQQQASPIGKWILSFQNVTSQYNRFGKKAFSDLWNRRMSPPYKTQIQSDMANMSRIGYYFAVQNMLFYGLQSALFAVMFGDNEDDEKFLSKKENMLNNIFDSILRGSGIYGGVVSTAKNMIFAFSKERDKTWNPDESSVILEMLNVSPAIGIKTRKIVNAEKTLNYNKDVIKEMETFDLDNPMWSAYTSYFEAITNVPVNRLLRKSQNVQESLNSKNSTLERIMLFMGWSKWNLGIDDEKIKDIKKQIKENKKKKKKNNKTNSEGKPIKRTAF